MAAKTKTSKVAKPASNFIPVALNLIDPSKTNPRKDFNKAKLDELAASIKEHGVLQAILLRPNGKRFELVAGERRYRASKIVGLKEIPSNVRELDDKQVLEIQVIENLQRDDISPLDEAAGYDGLIKKHGYTTKQLAAKVGKSVSYIEKRVRLVNLCDEARTDFLEGGMTLGAALLLARIPDQKLQEQAVYRAHDLDTDQLRAWIDGHVCTSLKGVPFSLTDPDLLPIAGACTACPSNTAVANELFDDFKAGEQCTNPSCFGKKVAAHWKNVTSEAKESGQKALSRAEGERIFAKEWGSDRVTLKHDSGYVEMSDKAEGHPKKYTWSQIVGKELKPILVLTKNNKLRKLYAVKDIVPLVKDQKWFKKPKVSKARSRGTSYDAGRDYQKESRQRDFFKKAYLQTAIRCVSSSLLTDFELLRQFFLADLANTDDWNLRGLVEAKQLKGGDAKKNRKAIEDYIKSLDTRGLVVYYFEVLLPHESKALQYIINEHDINLKAFDEETMKAFEEAEIELAKPKDVIADAPATEAAMSDDDSDDEGLIDTDDNGLDEDEEEAY